MNFHNVKFQTSYGRSDQFPSSERMEVVFSGRSNVGKSSAINKIFNRKQLARVSSMPGKTVTINFFTLENMDFVDLPGYGYAKVSKTEKARWKNLVESYFNSGRNIQLVFQLIDMRHAPTKDDLNMINFLIDCEFPFVIILTKKDKLSKAQQQKRMQELLNEIPYSDQIRIIPFSSLNGEGVEEIREIITQISESENDDGDFDAEDQN